MSKFWKMPLCAVAMAAALMLLAAGCGDSNTPGSGGETAPAPAGTNIPAGGTTGGTTGGPGGANIPGH